MQQIKELLKEICKYEKMSKDIKNSDITNFISKCLKIHKELQPFAQVASNTNLFKMFDTVPDGCVMPFKKVQITVFRGSIVFKVLPGTALKMSNFSKPCIEYRGEEIPLKPNLIKNSLSDFCLSFLLFGISYIYEHLDELKYMYEQVVINELQEKVEVLRKESLSTKRK